MKKFLKDLEIELKKLNVNPKEIKEILEDHKEMIEAAKQDGLNEDQISVKFGDPSKVAKDIKHDSVNDNNSGEIGLESVESVASFNTDDYTFVKAFTSVPLNIDFTVSLVNDDAILSDYEGEGIQIYQKDVKDLDDYIFELKDNELSIRVKKMKKIRSVITFNRKSPSFLVLIPKNMTFTNFNYNTVSGDLVINQLEVKNFKLKSTNGDIELSNVNLGVASFNLVNGDVEIDGMKALSLDISLVNGDIEMSNSIVKGKVYFNSVSGDFELSNVECDFAAFKTVNGDINGKNFYVDEVTLKSVSGDVRIENDDKTREIKVISKKTLSGDIKIN